MLSTKSFKVLLAAGAMALVAGGAQAATCSSGAIGVVTQNPSGAAAACDAGSTNNDKLNITIGSVTDLQVNWDNIHGKNDWIFAGKDDFGGSDEGGDVDVDFSTSGGLKFGTWDFVDDLFDKFSQVMIVIKGGSGNNTQENYVGYLLNSILDPDGRYTTPFFNDKNNSNAKDISHISAYVRGPIDNPPPVPLPAAGWLLFAGIGGLAALRSRKRAA